MKIKRDQITGLVLMALGVFFAVLISQFKTPFTAAYPGPSLLPGIGVFGLIVCGAGTFISGCRQKKEDAVFVTKEGWIRILVTFAILCAYVLGMKFLGFLIVTPIVFFIIVTYFAKSSKVESKLWVRIVFALAVTVIVWLVYVQLFGMTLPDGELFS